MLIDNPRVPVLEALLFGWMPGILKRFIYRLKGYRIGKRVSIGFGSILCGESVEVGDNVSIGFLTIIRGKEIKLGSHVQIGSTTFIDTPHIEIGEGSKINEQVFVGGLQFPNSRFILGRNCQIMQMSFINPACSVVIGDDTGIGGYSLIFGHSSWQSSFEGYPVKFEPIEIGKSVSLAWRVFVLPGSKIGDGAVIGANSVVNRAVPPRCLAVGFPASIISKAPEFPKELSEERKENMFKEIVDEMIDFFVASGLYCHRDGDCYKIEKPETKWWRKSKGPWWLQVVDKTLKTNMIVSTLDEKHTLLSFRTIPKEVRTKLSSKNAMWIDIDRKEQSQHTNELGDAVASFLRRYGVRTLHVE